MKKTLLILTLIGFLTIPSFAQGNSWNGGNGKGKHGPGWGIGFNGGIAELINKLPHEELSDEEIWGMTYMYEEEKLARDVYLTRHKTWKIKILSNIANSEQRHMDALKLLLQKYDIPLPVINDEIVNSPMERGLVDEDGNPIFGNTGW